MHAPRRPWTQRTEATCTSYVRVDLFVSSRVPTHQSPHRSRLYINPTGRAWRGGIINPKPILSEHGTAQHCNSIRERERVKEKKKGDRSKKKMAEGTANCIDILIAIILPPLGVFLKHGCGHEFWICLLLTFLGYIPGIIYAVYAITKNH
ncbi:unnamed protein product [Urochloa decumbens]|uniref:Uncharacterized protein n=2 Tax=Urochloa decumbens TaxID=240449 RepID=A0ABC9GN75_9POAL